MDVPASSTPALGRYRLLGELATGGMSEILLAMLTGPSGFEKLVVIKRILPHLARRPDFVRMFEDEARVVARIRHPNVVQVQELVANGADLFLVMDYLEGETASTLMRRSRSLREPFSFFLAAFIIAEAASGLHAAHELRGDDGLALGLVHRDVSPQNIFVTYDGHTMLLDFGIALFADRRVERTEAGQVKGKFQYMSPEQCSGGPLDRRSDIFSLGAVLYELSTGHSLFARDTPADSFRAICEEPIVAPSRLAPGYSPALEAVCLRALARDPRSRYATAQEMRRDLMAIVGQWAHDPREGLAHAMQRLFPERIRERHELAELVRRNRTIHAVPAGEIDTDVELPRAATMVEARQAVPGSKGRRFGVVLAATALFGALGIGVAVSRRTPLPIAVSVPSQTPSSEVDPPSSAAGSATLSVAPASSSLPRTSEARGEPSVSAPHRRRRPGVPARSPSRPAAPTSADDDFHRF